MPRLLAQRARAAAASFALVAGEKKRPAAVGAVGAVGAALAFEVHLAKERKGVVADYRFAGELRSLPVDL